MTHRLSRPPFKTPEFTQIRPFRLSSAALILLLAGNVACNGDPSGTSVGADSSDSESDGSASGGSASGGEDETEPEPEPESERITGIGVGGGPDELTYWGLDLDEVEPWGPAAYLVDHLGLNWLADGPGHKILVIDDDGQIVDRYDLEGLVRGVEDIEVTETHVYVLTVGGAEPVIARAGRNDAAPSAWETFSIPADNLDLREVTGLRKDANGVISVELSFGGEHLPLFSADGNLIADAGAPTSTFQVDGHSVELTGYTGEDGDDPSHGALIVDDVEVTSIETAGMLGDFSLIAVTPDGDVWLRVADVGMFQDAFATQMFAYRFSLDGTLEQVVQMPMQNELVWVEHRITMDTEGEIRVLSTGAGEVAILRAAEIGLPMPLGIPLGVAPYLPGSEVPATAGTNDSIEAPDPGPVHDESTCMSRQEIMQRANAYRDYTAVYNINHMKPCANRTPLSYFQNNLNTQIQGVAYKYAGHIEVSTYDTAVKNNQTVGDLNTPTDKKVDNCSVGVDCSGFVSKAWRSGHYSTGTLHNVSTNLNNYAILQPGDALNKPFSHVRLVAAPPTGWGVKVVESTVGKDYMRVVEHPISWGKTGYGAGYIPVRYNKVCPDAAPPPPPPPASTDIVFDVSGYLPSNSGYVPVGPTRLLDTRMQGADGMLDNGEVLQVAVAGLVGLPPANAIGAVVLNVTVASPQGAGYLSAYPDNNYPSTSNINFSANEPTPGLVIINPGGDGKIDLRHVIPGGGKSHVVVDVFGYFPPSADIHMVTPARVFDSRLPEFGAALIPAGTKDVQLAGVGGIPLQGVGAVIANVTEVNAVGNGFATVHEAGTPTPVTSNLNYITQTARANLVIIPVSDAGFATIYTTQSANFIVDVFGWFGEGVDFEPISPLRLRDTRVDEDGKLGHSQWLSIDAVGAPEIPEGVVAVFGNLTAVQPTGWGYLQVYPDTVPNTSNLNFNGGKTVANAILTEVSPGGQLRVHAVFPP